MGHLVVFASPVDDWAVAVPADDQDGLDALFGAVAGQLWPGRPATILHSTVGPSGVARLRVRHGAIIETVHATLGTSTA